MEFAMEATLPEGVKIGTRKLHRDLPQQTAFIILAKDEPRAVALIERALGEKVAQKSFSFDVDDTFRWFRETTLTGNGPYQEGIDTLALAQRQLGSIEITGAVLSFAAQGLQSFWVETAEGDRRRVLTGDNCGTEGSFYPMPEGWEFDPATLAAAVVSQY